MNADQTETKADAEAAALKQSAAITPLAHPAMAIQPGGTDAKADTGDAAADVSTLTREQLEARVKMLTENLASANTESEFFRKQWQDLRLRDEALGVEALTVDQRNLEDKHVLAVTELYQSVMKQREGMALLAKILTSTSAMLQTAPNYTPSVRADYEVACRAAKDYLAGRSGAAIPIGESLSEGKISDVNPQLNSVIMNLGKSQGVKEGMPFLIFQDNQPVGMVKVVLARDLVSAAMVQNLKPNTVLKVGDRVAVDAGQ